MGVKYSKPLDPKVSKSSTETPNFYCIIYMGLDMEQRDTTIINIKKLLKKKIMLMSGSFSCVSL